MMSDEISQVQARELDADDNHSSSPFVARAMAAHLLVMGSNLRRAGAAHASPMRSAMGQLRMCSTKPGYWAGNFTPKAGLDMDKFAANYRSPMIESLKPFGGKLVMVAPKPATVYYHGDAGAVNWIAEFPSVQHAQAWHDSEAYQKLIPYRDSAITASFVIAEGTGA